MVRRVRRQQGHQPAVRVAHRVIRQHRQQVVKRVVSQAERRPQLRQPFAVGKCIRVQQLIEIAPRTVRIVGVAVRRERADLIDGHPEQHDEIDLGEDHRRQVAGQHEAGDQPGPRRGREFL